MKVRHDNTGKTPKIGDKIAYNPPYYKGLEIHTVTGFAKSGLPYLGDNKDTPKTGFVIVEEAPSKVKTITRKVFSVSGDFPEDLYDYLTEESSPDCFKEYTANTKETLEAQGYENDEVANHLITLGAEDNEKVLIEIDY